MTNKFLIKQAGSLVLLTITRFIQSKISVNFSKLGLVMPCWKAFLYSMLHDCTTKNLIYIYCYMITWQKGLTLLYAAWLHDQKPYLYLLLQDYMAKRPDSTVCCMIAWPKTLFIFIAAWLHGKKAWLYCMLHDCMKKTLFSFIFIAARLHGKKAWLYSTVCCMIAWQKPYFYLYLLLQDYMAKRPDCTDGTE